MLDLMQVADRLRTWGFAVTPAEDWTPNGTYVPVIYCRNHGSYRIRESDEVPESVAGMKLTEEVVDDIRIMQAVMDMSQLKGNDE